MIAISPHRASQPRRWACAVMLCILGWVCQTSAQTPLPGGGKSAPAVAPNLPDVHHHSPAEKTVSLTLGQCLKIAQERQPTLAALRASLNAAIAGRQALDTIRGVSSVLTPDLCLRKQQADRGILAAQAELAQAEHDVNYAVIRMYYSVVLAQRQAALAEDIIAQMETYLEFVNGLIKDGATTKEINVDTRDTLLVYLSQLRGKRTEAKLAQERAMAGLREAMGVGCEMEFLPADQQLPEMNLEVEKATVVDLACSRRGEMTLASMGVEIVWLETSAQSAIRFRPLTRTFAAGSDLHAKQVPQGSREAEYRPNAIGLEMPSHLVGDRTSRMARSAALGERADAVLQKTKNLITLEAENAFLKWQETRSKAKHLKEGAAAAKKLVERVRNDAGGSLKKSEQLTTEVLTAQALAAYNESLFQQILALAALERVTAGGVFVQFPGR